MKKDRYYARSFKTLFILTENIIYLNEEINKIRDSKTLPSLTLNLLLIKINFDILPFTA